jgi:sterol desaturase/sphingolipid hydroxylase (fatty acid hydroxylase superfamily)
MHGDVLWALGGMALAFAIGTFVEWLVHYLMHRRILLGKVHSLHHAEGTGQGWFGEFLVYFFPSLPFMVGSFLIAWLVLDVLWLGVGMVIGGTFYAAFAAYAHQVQHERPELTFWMRRPVHYIHHAHNMWHHNFGISFDFWDRIFGTYRVVEYKANRPIRFSDFFRIHWYYYTPSTDEAKPLPDAPPSPDEISYPSRSRSGTAMAN